MIGCGAGLPPEERSNPLGGSTGGTGETPASCALTGGELDFAVDQLGSFLFWATDPQIDIRVDEAKAKLLLDVPENQLPQGTTSAQIRISPEPDADLPLSGHVDTAFRIDAITPQDMAGFAGGAQNPLTLTIRYDPVACEISPDVEAGLVLGRLNSNGQWQEICGTRADVGRRQVSCSEGDLSFGVFGVIGQAAALNDSTPPFFPNTAQTLSARPCLDTATCGTPYIDFQWGAASDGGGSGVKGYRLYVDGARAAFVANVSGNPIQYTFIPTGSLDIRSTHKYQITAVDAADNESALYGALFLP
jgi:hypothetical protein